jgi:hypothetical protein
LRLAIASSGSRSLLSLRGDAGLMICVQNPQGSGWLTERAVKSAAKAAGKPCHRTGCSTIRDCFFGSP